MIDRLATEEAKLIAGVKANRELPQPRLIEAQKD